MEEVDAIIINFLRQVDVEISDKIRRIVEIPLDQILEGIAKCILTIEPTSKIISNPPKGISHRIDYAAQLASLCKELGYQNEIGYQTLLYFNEKDLRKVFMFLVEKLPCDLINSDVNEWNVEDPIITKIKSKIEEELNGIWKPINRDSNHFQKSGRNGNIKVPEPKTQKNENELQTLSTEKVVTPLMQPVLTQECLTNAVQVYHEVEPSVIQSLNKDVIELREAVELKKLKNAEISSELQKIQRLSKKLELEAEELKSLKEVITSTNCHDGNVLSNLPDKLKHDIAKLSLQSDEINQKCLNLIAVKSQLEKEQSHASLRKDQIDAMKRTAKELNTTIRQKEVKKRELRKELDNLNSLGAKHRTYYTKKIMDIMNNQEKQKQEIEKIKMDTRDIDKEIQYLNRQLDRTFCLAEELFRKGACRGSIAKRTHELIVRFHQDCSKILKLTHQAGATSSENIEVEDKICVEKSKRLDEVLKRVREDLEQMRREIHMFSGDPLN